MTAEFSEMGIRFAYPETWEVSGDKDPELPRSVSVHSPEGAFWSVSEDRREPAVMAAEVLETMRAEYEEFEAEPIERIVEGRALLGYEIHFCCLDLLISAHILAAEGGGTSQVLLYQAESRDFDQLRAVFDAISLSFLRGRYGDVDWES